MISLAPRMLMAVWRWSQLAIALLMVAAEHFVRHTLSFIFSVIPLSACLAILGISRSKVKTQEDAEMEMDTCEFIESRGFPSEKHFVTTPDGYILGLQRIPSKDNLPDGADEAANEAYNKRPASGVVLMIHGFMQSSEAFVVRRDSSNSIPLTLAAAGYDVWLGNNRGNKYSLKHTTRKPAHEDFWDYSLDEMIRYDLPSMIQYVLAHSGAQSLTLIGFSQGTAQSFGCLSSNPQLAQKVNLFIALAPVSEVRGFSNPVVESLARSRPDFVFLLFGKKSILPSTLFWRKILSRKTFVDVIDRSVNFLFGWTAACIDPEEKALLYSHIYSYSSVKTVVHWFQIIQNTRFQMFDDTLSVPASNNPYDRYASQVLPQYRTMQLQCPVACFYGGRDNLPNTKAVLANIPKDKVALFHKEDDYEHLDFMWAKDTGKTICPRVLSLLEKYNPIETN